MQESLKKFREEAKKLEESEALKEARRKFESIEGTASKTDSSVFKEHMKGVADKVCYVDSCLCYTIVSTQNHRVPSKYSRIKSRMPSDQNLKSVTLQTFAPNAV